MTASDPDDMLDRLDAGEPPASAEEAAARKPYERLLADLAAVDDAEPPAGWEARLEARRRREAAPSPRSWRWLLPAGALGAAGLAAVILLTCRGQGQAPRLAMDIRAADGALRRSGAVVGDVVQAQALLDRTHGELRIYRDTALVARCPGDAPCRRDGRRVSIDLPSAEPGEYRAISFRADAPIPPPGRDGLESDLLDARQAGVIIDRLDAVTITR